MNVENKIKLNAFSNDDLKIFSYLCQDSILSRDEFLFDKDKDLRSYRLDFSKMKKFFNLEPGSDLLNATKIIVDNINSKKYGDLESKKYYNT